MTDFVVREVDGGFVLPVAGFVCSEVRGDDELILRSADSTAEAWVSGSRIGEDLMRQLVEREARVVGAGATRDSTLQIFFRGRRLDRDPCGREARGLGGPRAWIRPGRCDARRRRAGYLGRNLGDSHDPPW